MTRSTPKLAFIGVGNMASAIIGGLIATGYPADSITGTNRSEEKQQLWRDKFGINTTHDNNLAIETADIVVLAVKPQMMESVVRAMSPALQQQKPMLISVAAGPTVESIDLWAGGDMAIVRCMPNTPSMLQCGVAGLYANQKVNPEQKQQAEAILNAVGICRWLKAESGIDSIIAVAGSAPAYYYLFMEAMIESGKKLGFSHEDSTELAVQTALGAVRMARETGTDVVELRRQVTSPGGTTAEAIKTFEEGGLRQLIDNAMHAAIKRSQELAKA